jgi:hypothetical protein
VLQVLGSFWYLKDDRLKYPLQNEADPLKDRLQMFLNAKDCALEWITESARRAVAAQKPAIVFLFHAKFYSNSGTSVLPTNGIGDYYSPSTLQAVTGQQTGTKISNPYEPLFQHLTATALEFPQLMFYVVHADGHAYSTSRLNGNMQNVNGRPTATNHNLMVHQVEGVSRALTMYSRLVVDDPSSFQPVTIQQRWSRQAYSTSPVGHTWVPV